MNVRLIRVFVSSPGDVRAERDLLDKAVDEINRGDGPRLGVVLQTFRWEKDVVPSIGPPPQDVVDGQTPTCDIYLGIMSARFGTPTSDYGSGTEQEFQHALKRWGKCGQPWLLFYFHNNPPTPRTAEEALQFVEVLKFRESLQKAGIIGLYESPDKGENSFLFQVTGHLRKIVHTLVPMPPGPPGQKPSDPTAYLSDLLTKTSFIDIRGLQVGKGQAHRFPIEDLYISLTTTLAGTGVEDAQHRRGNRLASEEEIELGIRESRDVPLHTALHNDRLVVIGDPGAGKTTFLRRIAHALCQTQLAQQPDAARVRLGIADRTFPAFIRLSELAQHIQRHGGRATAPSSDDAPTWLPHYLATASQDNGWGLEADFFRDQLEGGLCAVLLDGLDEAPDRFVRAGISRLIENATNAYTGCRFVVTSRPTAYAGEVVLPEFGHARIDPLSDEAVETFLSHWCGALYVESREAAQEHCRELLDALRGRPDIRRMARNPVMLTALAVVHWNERRLPEQRADLYESIIHWLSRSREARPGRATAEQTVVRLQELALAMQNDAGGRKTQVSKRWAAEKLAAEIGAGPVSKDTVKVAERFLDEEEIDSGIIVGRGHDASFWHLTFQEFMAAKAIASRLEPDQHRILFSDPNKVYLADWREVVLLLAGTLHQQGRAKVDGLVSTILDGQSASPGLADQARCAGLLGSVLCDLKPADYQVSDSRYAGLLHSVMAIFDRERSQSVPIETRIAAADALGQAGDVRIDFNQEDYWITISAGKFLMGAQPGNPQGPNYDQNARDDEAPVHEVHLHAYRIARYPVTVGQYRQFLAEDAYQDRRWWKAGGFGEFKEPEKWEEQLPYPSRPVVGVSWWEAAAYCVWAGYRLPSEAEWERAARGTEGRKYPWGNEPPDETRTNYWDTGIRHPTPVGIFPGDVTPEGALDLGGNVLEWCEDWYGNYSVQPVARPSNSEVASHRVIRGGSWGHDARGCRAAGRDWYEPRDRYGDVGFRVAAVSPGGQPKTSP